MITNIHLKDIASFSSDGTEMSGLSEINFVYGENGTGKTTISNFIESKDNGPSCNLGWDGGVPVPTLVYNKHFRETHFGVTDVPGVFTIGKATIEEIAKIEEKKKKLSDIVKEGKQRKLTLEKKAEELKQCEAEFSEWCWSHIKKDYEACFKDVFEGALGSKSKMVQLVKNNFIKVSPSPVPSIEDLKERATTLFGEQPPILKKIEIPDFSALKKVENDEIWSKKIVGSSDIGLGKLIMRLNIFDWVNQGRTILKDDSNICPFCQQHTISDDFRRELEKLFDEDFKRDKSLVEQLQNEYLTSTNLVISSLRSVLSVAKTNKYNKLELAEFEAQISLLDATVDKNHSVVSEKKRELSRSLLLESTEEICKKAVGLICAANIKIEKHNQEVSNFAVSKALLKKDVWIYISANKKDDIEKQLKKIRDNQRAIDGITQSLDNLKAGYKKLDQDIKSLTKNVTSVQTSIDEINRVLELYGFNGFRIQPSKESNKYQIQRGNGELANETLSEGEMTFITFLYFLQLVKGGENEESANEDRIVVIDDPVSSLDSSVIYVVSSLIKDLIREIHGGSIVKQLIVLTHNIFFHKEVSFIDGRDQERKYYSFYVVRKMNEVSTIECCGSTNPIKNSYQMLWEDVRNFNDRSIITLQNAMRRIYEWYFRILGDLRDNNILSNFTDKEERKIAESLLCWINDGSHTIPDDYLLVPSQDMCERYLNVFEKVFEVSGHIAHYKMMMGIDKDK